MLGLRLPKYVFVLLFALHNLASQSNAAAQGTQVLPKTCNQWYAQLWQSVASKIEEPGEFWNHYKVDYVGDSGGQGSTVHLHDPTNDREYIAKWPSEKEFGHYTTKREYALLRELNEKKVRHIPQAVSYESALTTSNGKVIPGVLIQSKVGNNNLKQIQKWFSNAESAEGDAKYLSTILKAFYDLTQTLEDLHKLGIVHRDIKASNIVIDAQNQAHLIDFGISVSVNDLKKELKESDYVLGTKSHIAPEIINDDFKNADTRSDYYSLGATLMSLVFKQNLSDNYRDNLALLSQTNFLISKEANQSIKDLILELLHADPSLRLTNPNEIRLRLLGIMEQLKFTSEASTNPASH